jgi:hypothetical protein
MNILELYHRGVIGFLHRKGLLSNSILTYVEYYKRFKQERSRGAGYRESVRRLSKEFGVSETTIKKAVRLIHESDETRNEGNSPYNGHSLMQSLN